MPAYEIAPEERDWIIREPDYEADFESMRQAGARLAEERERRFFEAFFGKPLEKKGTANDPPH